jgi:hypothetical protein
MHSSNSLRRALPQRSSGISRVDERNLNRLNPFAHGVYSQKPCDGLPTFTRQRVKKLREAFNGCMEELS